MGNYILLLTHLYFYKALFLTDLRFWNKIPNTERGVVISVESTTGIQTWFYGSGFTGKQDLLFKNQYWFLNKRSFYFQEVL